MARHNIVRALVVTAALGAPSLMFAQTGTYTTIDYPGAVTLTIPWAFNSRGDVVGIYRNAGGTHGFLLSNGQYTSIDYPGSNDTEIYGTNSQGDMHGYYADTNGVHHGLLISNGKMTTVDVPGAAITEGWGISDRGDVVGSWTDSNKVVHGYLYSGGRFTTVDFPGASTTGLTGVNAAGDVSGIATIGGTPYAFVMSGGDYTLIGYAGATYTNSTGLNNRGDVVGRFITNGVTHGYSLSGGQYSTFDYPGATFTGLTASDGRGSVLGRYIATSDNQQHGFLLTGFRPACLANLPSPQVAAITHSADFTAVSSSKPASAGEVLSLFAKGLGATLPNVGSGQPFPAGVLAQVSSLVEVRVNGRSTIVYGAVGLPGTVDGYQVNFRLPADVAKGSAKIELSAGGSVSAVAMITVQ